MITVKGKIRINGKWVNFKKTFEDSNKDSAVQKTYALMGSNHKLTKSLVKIEEVV